MTSTEGFMQEATHVWAIESRAHSSLFLPSHGEEDAPLLREILRLFLSFVTLPSLSLALTCPRVCHFKQVCLFYWIGAIISTARIHPRKSFQRLSLSSCTVHSLRLFYMAPSTVNIMNFHLYKNSLVATLSWKLEFCCSGISVYMCN